MQLMPTIVARTPLLAFVLLLSATVRCFRLSSDRVSFRSSRSTGVASLRAGIDVSGLPMVPIPEELQFDAITAADGTWNDISNALILAGGLSYLAYEKRPRGSARDDLIEVRQSNIPGANLGVFAKKVIPQGTTIGRFPGFLTTAEAALASKTSDKARALAKKYMYAINEEQVIDPTNPEGGVDLEISFLFGLIKVDTTIARINEPPVGGDVNVYTKIDQSGVIVTAERNIFNGEEIFMDYGRVYDRSDYERQERMENELAAKAEARKRLEEEEMLRLQPITTDKVDPSTGRAAFDQDTSMPDGFIRKLAKQDENRYKKAGIISPEEGAGMFSDLGANMFGSDEDRELLVAMQGKTKDQDPSSSSSGEKQRMADFFGRDDEDLMRSLKQQMGSASADEVPDVTAAGASASSMFDSLMGGKEVKANAAGPKITPSSAPSAPSSAGSMDTSTSGAAGAVGNRPEYRPALTVEEAEELNRSLDDMTDAEVQRVLQKLQSAVNDKLKEEMSGALASSGITPSPKKMPRAPSMDPEMRKKYGKELDAIENELEKIYSDPLGVWQELMANPDKFLNEQGPKSPGELTDDDKQ